LRATDKIQRDIEDYFKLHDWFYDRRKNYYKNIGKPINRIIGIPNLAQAMMAIVCREPHIARGRPTSIIKKDADYARIFNSTINPNLYLLCAQIMGKIDGYIRINLLDIPLPLKTNFRFQIAMISIINLFDKVDYTIDDLLRISPDQLNNDIIENATETVLSKADEYTEDAQLSYDTAAKQPYFTDYLIHPPPPPESISID
jgi:hypothetical protein